MRGGTVVARHAFLVALSVLWLLAGAEALDRFTGGWRFDQVALAPRARVAATPAAAEAARARQNGYERALLAEATYNSEVDPEWFFLPPAPMEEASGGRLAARTAANPTMQEQENYVWNDALFGPHPDAHLLALLPELKLRQIFAFHSYDGSTVPRYRLFPSHDFSPVPWVTDRYGWLSVEMRTPKPPHTIRIGIIGDSTSHNFYGRQIQSYLNAWAAAAQLGVSFEVLNAARQGLEQGDELAVLKNELAPMGLDYTYAYFAPIFAIAGYTPTFAVLPPGVAFGHPTPAKPAWTVRLAGTLTPLTRFSAVARDVVEQTDLNAPDSMLPEPPKPKARLRLPKGVRGSRIDLAAAGKDPYFAQLIGFLNQMQAVSSKIGSRLVVSDEWMCVWPGMMLNRTSDRIVNESLNGPLFWPLTYAQISRLLRAHNGTIDAWAAENHVPVVNVDGKLPRDPSLCSDAFHDQPLGTRLRAWIIFQRLIPLIEQDLLAHRVPRDNADPSGHNPAFAAPIEYLDRDALLRRMEAEQEEDSQPPKPSEPRR